MTRINAAELVDLDLLTEDDLPPPVPTLKPIDRRFIDEAILHTRDVARVTPDPLQ